MDALSSSLLSPNATAPDKLAEERSALSQVYSDTHSMDPDLVDLPKSDPSSLQPLASPQVASQDTTPISNESILIAQIVDDLKIFRALQDFFAFAPLTPQISSKKPSKFLAE